MAYYSGNYGSMGGVLTPAVRFFLVATGLVFVLQWGLKLNADPRFLLMFSLNAECLRHLYLWQLVTYLFLHGGFWHIVLNMLGLFFFGPETERTLGTRRFAALYLVSGIIGGLGWLLLIGNHAGFCVGASGAVFGVLGAFAALYPDRSVTLLVFFIIPVTMRARTMAIGLGLFSLFAAISAQGQIAYAAHLAGGLAGYAYIHWIFRRGFSSASLDPRQWARGLRRAVNDACWRWQRRKFKVISSDAGWSDEAAPDPAEVDAILEKVSKWGLGRLTRREREILERASRK